MNKPGRRTLLIALAIVSVAIICALFAFGVKPGSLPEPDHIPASERGIVSLGAFDDRTASSGESNQRPVSAADQLPKLGVPLRLVESDLKARAARGDTVAMCRLFTDYDYCSEEKRQKEWLPSALALRESDLANAQTDRERASISVAIRALKEEMATAPYGQAAKLCAGVEVPSAAERLRYLRSAALAGNVPAKSLYGRGAAYRLLYSDPDAMKTYLGEAEQMVIEAAKAGDMASLTALAQAYDPETRAGGSQPLTDATQPDAEKSLSYYLQLRAIYAQRAGGDAFADGAGRTLERRIAALKQKITPSQMLAATAEASQRMAQWTPPSRSREMSLDALSSDSRVNRELCVDNGDRTPTEDFINLPDGSLATPDGRRIQLDP